MKQFDSDELTKIWKDREEIEVSGSELRFEEIMSEKSVFRSVMSKVGQA